MDIHHLKLIVSDQDSMQHPLRFAFYCTVAYNTNIHIARTNQIILNLLLELRFSASVKVICELQKGGFSTVYLALYVPTKEICVVRYLQYE